MELAWFITVGVLFFSVCYFLFQKNEKNDVKKNIKEEEAGGGEVTKQTLIEENNKTNDISSEQKVNGRVEIRVVYGTTTGTAKNFTNSLTKKLPPNALLNSVLMDKGKEKNIINPLVKLDMFPAENADGADPWDMLESSEAEDEFQGKTSRVHIIIMSTWTGGVAPVLAQRWLDAFLDMSTDFRVGSSAMHGVRFAVYGLGSSEYDEHWCTAAQQIFDGFMNMGATPLVRLGKGDDTKDMGAHFNEWCEDLIDSLESEDIAFDNMQEAIFGKTSKNLQTESSECCGGGGGGGDDECGCEKGGNDDISNPSKAKKKGPKKVIKGAPRPKRTKEDRRQLAASKGNADAAALTGDIEVSQEDLENDRLLRVADLEDSDADSDIETSIESNKKQPKNGGGGGGGGEGLVDLEDMGSEMMKSASQSGEVDLKKAMTDDLNNDNDDADDNNDEDEDGGGGCGAEEEVEVAELMDDRPEMVTPLQRKALTKEGYKIIGTHSAVKLCRWTKHQLRGRGGCYKHTFYGITSYQCMEATPSLACANKCVFCWRHHKNPVGREWRWKEDSPEDIVKDAISLHTRMVNEFKGAKGVHADRIKEAMTVKHCALSLVGEPIMYPKINEMCTELHKRKISTFLVTNAQFPDEIAALVPVTQLYVSIDAATKESLKAVDRPLFKDYWERFLGCLDELKKKGQRTVYRLTLVKQWNMNEVDQYVELLLLGEPDLIEIKAVTFCGTSDASSLTMENVPWHHEVVTFAKAIEAHPKTMGKYGLAAVHAHSCCTLLAKKDIYFSSPNENEPPRWRTWIDYPKFHYLEEQWRLHGTTFSSQDYLADTPHWALPDAAEEGFDPIECRVRRNRKGEEVPINYKSSESGCG